jgi:hypothetical protein
MDFQWHSSMKNDIMGLSRGQAKAVAYPNVQKSIIIK